MLCLKISCDVAGRYTAAVGTVMFDYSDWIK